VTEINIVGKPAISSVLAKFDDFTESYDRLHAQSTRLAGEETSFFAEYKIANVRAELDRSPKAILDFGCGIGNSIPYWKKYFGDAQLTCADVSEKSLQSIREQFPDAKLHTQQITGQALALSDKSFDLLYAACVFHHIDAKEHIQWLREMRRMATPGARLAIFEHNPYNPLTQKAVKDCPFDDDAVLIRGPEFRRRVQEAGWTNVRLDYVLFFPKFLAPFRFLEKHLSWLPLGAQYVVYGEA